MSYNPPPSCPPPSQPNNPPGGGDKGAPSKAPEITKPPAKPEAHKPSDLSEADKQFILNDVQGDVVFGFSKQHELFWFFRILDAKEFKENVHKLNITSCQAVLDKKADIQKARENKALEKAPFLNISFSSAGLKLLGFKEELKEDPKQVKQNKEQFKGHEKAGFESGQRTSAKSLGDRGKDRDDGTFNAEWDSWLEDPKNPIHGLLLITGETRETCDDLEDHVRKSMLGSIHPVNLFEGQVRPKPYRGHEHFGWLDDISNPAIKGLGIDGNGTFLPGQIRLDPGVLLCGMDGDQSIRERPPWAKGGSFIAFRKLRQFVPEFHDYLAVTAGTVLRDPSEEGAHKLGAHLVGRWKSGAPLQLTPEKDDEELGKDPHRNNKFTFPREKGDEGQVLCPYASHIRKTNPRSDLEQFPGSVEQHAIRRAGITYGPEVEQSELDDKRTDFDRGLAFLCYQSDLAYGFEFMQLAWANNTEFPIDKGVDAGFDPLIGQRGGQARDTWGTSAGPKIKGMREFVRSRGGEYFFAPRISVLKEIGKHCSGS